MMRPLTFSPVSLFWFAPVDRGVLARRPRAVQVHLDDRVEVLGRHVEDRAVPNDAGVVHEDVEPTELRHGLLDHLAGLVVVRHVGVVGRRHATAVLDDLHGLIRRSGRALTRHRSAEVVDQHVRPVLGQLHRVAAADAVPRPRDDGHLAVEQTHDSYRSWSCATARGALTPVSDRSSDRRFLAHSARIGSRDRHDPTDRAHEPTEAPGTAPGGGGTGIARGCPRGGGRRDLAPSKHHTKGNNHDQHRLHSCLDLDQGAR